MCKGCEACPEIEVSKCKESVLRSGTVGLLGEKFWVWGVVPGLSPNLPM